MELGRLGLCCRPHRATVSLCHGFLGTPLGLWGWEGKACSWVSGLSHTTQLAEVIFNLFHAITIFHFHYAMGTAAV